MNNSAIKAESKLNKKMMYGALPHYITAGILGWVLSVFTRTIYSQESINDMLQLGIATYAVFLLVYVVKLIFSHCEQNNLGLLGSRSRIAAASIMVAVYLFLRVWVM